jgi:hypothetical protein
MFGNLVVVALAAFPVSGCGSAVSPDELSGQQSSLSVPTETYNFSESLHFCKKVSYGLGHVTFCTPHIGFSGAVSVGNYTTVAGTGIPEAATVELNFDSPVNKTVTSTVCIGGSNEICEGIGDSTGVSLDGCVKPESYKLDTSGRTVSFKLRLSIKGSAKVSGVGISSEVTLYTTPTLTIPY